jgi:arrestin-related trafficking adapter 1
MPSKLFGLPSPREVDKPRSAKSSPFTSPATSRRSSLNMDQLKRPGLAGLAKLGSSDKKDKNRSSSKDKTAKGPASPTLQQKPVKLGMYMESPPALFIGTPTQSMGVLMSGRLQVTPMIPEATLETIVMWLECTTHTKKPVQDRCRDCQTQVTDEFEWHFLTKPKVFWADQGMQELPFSHLIPGKLPATTHGHLGSIDYSLHVRAKASDGQEIEFRREIDFRRALLPGNDKNSVRIFPPTNLNLQVTLPSVIHPIGEFPVNCRMTGISTQRGDTQVRWALRKLIWRIEENEKMVSPACTKHANKVGGEGKGIEHENSREVGMEELKQGWKTDHSDGVVEGEFMAHIDSNAKIQCDMESQYGLKISHHLILELVIAEEWATNKRPESATPTGAARVLRTQFNLNVTERAGMGLSWTDEMPPMYEDVPDSPPRYLGEHTTITDYDGEDLHEDIEQMTLTP